MTPASAPRPVRQYVYGILISVVAGTVAARILNVADVFEPYRYRAPEDTQSTIRTWPTVRPAVTPTLGGNDRSRWATVRALVDEGTYVIGRRDPARVSPTNKYGDYGIFTEDGWKTLDMVRKPGTEDFYSSKPPLLPTLLAGEYWALKKAFGWSITDPHGQVIRTTLLTVNWLPLVVYLILLSRLVERLGTTDWGRLFVFAAGCFASYQIPFSVVLNNHCVATWSALFALYFALTPGPRAPGLSLVLAGFFAAFTACNELPATSFAVALLAILLVRRPLGTLAFFIPAALLPVAGFFITNYRAIGQLAPAYSEFGGPWYNFPGSYWDVKPGVIRSGIDFAWQKETRLDYAFNLLVGHHGLFSLSPIFLLAVAGMVIAVVGHLRRDHKMKELGALADLENSLAASYFRRLTELPIIAGVGLILAVTVVGFYVVKSNNYGGWTSGPRWLMWLTPIFLLGMLPCADWLARRKWGRGLGYVLLAFSVLSVSYPASNPWRHPWIYNLLEALGRINY